MTDDKPTNNKFQALTGREDAYFISQQNWLAVADGVGLGSLEGILSTIFGYPLKCLCFCPFFVST